LDRAHSAAALLGDLQKPPVSKRAPPAESRCSEYGLCVWESESEERERERERGRDEGRKGGMEGRKKGRRSSSSGL